MLKDLPKVGNWMAKIDLKDAYFMIPMAREFLRFQWKDKTYSSTACHSVCHQLHGSLPRLVATLPKLGLHLIINIDVDILVMAEIDLQKDHVTAVVYMLDNLGFIINHPKSELTPNQEIEYLGFIVNSTAMELKLPGQKIKKSEARQVKPIWCQPLCCPT